MMITDSANLHFCKEIVIYSVTGTTTTDRRYGLLSGYYHINMLFVWAEHSRISNSEEIETVR